MSDAFDPSALVRDYGDIAGEAAACRNDAARFDFSFMSSAALNGRAAAAALATITDRAIVDLKPGHIRYALRHGPAGYLESDLTVWNDGARTLVMSGRHRDIADLAAAERELEDCSETSAIFAVQGPKSLNVFNGLTDMSRLAALPYFGFSAFDLAGVDCLIGRLGYTGERGFEVIAPADHGAAIWDRLAARARPAGFAAADRLRIEAGFVLFANEFRLPVRAAEVGLQAFAGTDEPPPRFRLVCFRADTDVDPVLWRPLGEVAPPPPGTITVTSACYSDIAGGILGLGFVPATTDHVATPIDSSGTFGDVHLLDLPFYDTAKRRPRGDWA